MDNASGSKESGAVRLLHISDLHFGADHKFYPEGETTGQKPQLYSAIDAALTQASINVDYLLIAGDLLTKGDDKGKAAAIDGIRRLQEALNIRQENTFIIPGNHDKSDDKEYAAYDEIVQACGSSECSRTNLPVVVQLGGTPRVTVELCLIDSTGLETKKSRGTGAVGFLKLRRITDAFRNHSIGWRVAAMHHHLVPVAPDDSVKIEPKGMAGDLAQAAGGQEVTNDDPTKAQTHFPSSTADAARVLSEFPERYIDCVMHGHQHTPAIIEYRNCLSPTPRILYVLAAGSCGSRYEAGQFFVHEFSRTHLNVLSFQQQINDSMTFQAQKTVSLAHPSIHERICLEQMFHIRETDASEFETTSSTVPTQGKADPSIYYLFATVRDHKVATEKIKEVIAKANRAKADKRKISLTGLYSTTGRWDIAVRMETNGYQVDTNELKSAIGRALADLGQIDRRGGKYELSQIYRGEKSLFRGSPSSKLIRSAGDYDKYGCQRHFIVVTDGEAPDLELQDGLVQFLQSNHAVAVIVEEVVSTDRGLVIEIFTTCSQARFVNQLSLKVDNLRHENFMELPKSTLSCYQYFSLS
jgi:DNA repair exonuclease SbcCD nuclease subunit